MTYYVAIHDGTSTAWRLLYRSGSLSVALQAYRAVAVRPGQRKVLAEWGGAGWLVLAWAAEEEAQVDTWQARGDGTEQASYP